MSAKYFCERCDREFTDQTNPEGGYNSRYYTCRTQMAGDGVACDPKAAQSVTAIRYGVGVGTGAYWI
jgi:hypothetical protein